MGRVINYRGAAYDTSIDNLEQIADVNSVVIRWFNADLVVHIISMASARTNLAIEVCLFCRELDSDHSTPPASPFQVFHGFEPRFHCFRFPWRVLSASRSTGLPVSNRSIGAWLLETMACR